MCGDGGIIIRHEHGGHCCGETAKVADDARGCISGRKARAMIRERDSRLLRCDGIKEPRRSNEECPESDEMRSAGERL